MIDPFEHFLVILAAWVVCVLFRRIAPATFLTFAGLLFTLAFAPLAAGWIAFTAMEAALLFYLLKDADRGSAWRKYGMYLVLPNLLAVDLHPFVFGFNIETLAISFSTIRTFMTGKQLLSARKPEPATSVWWIAVAAFWLPSLIIGPVFSGTSLRKQALETDAKDVNLRDYRLVLQGLVLAMLLNPLLGRIGDYLTGEGMALDQWMIAPILFLQLFTAFWGQSLVAEHTSRFFGFTLPVNFNEPWKARDIRDFWQRWHRSMAEFVMQYIFLPLQLRGISPRLATVCAFVFMGLWHNVSIGYAVWGLSHGLLLAYWKPKPVGFLGHFSTRLVMWLLIISLSFIANFGMIDEP